MKDPALEWIRDACRGDEAAAARWIGEYQGRIYAFLRRLSGTDAMAGELTQRAFCRAWGSAAAFEGRSTVSAWMHGIAYRTFVDWLRTEGRTEARPDEWWAEVPSTAAGPDLATSDSDAAVAVYTAVDRLGHELRETVHLHYYQGLSLEETADSMGVATSTVKYRLRQALEEVRRRVGDCRAGIERSASDVRG